MKEDGYAGGANYKQGFELFDVVRIDHFRGFSTYWEIQQKTQQSGNGLRS